MRLPSNALHNVEVWFLKLDKVGKLRSWASVLSGVAYVVGASALALTLKPGALLLVSIAVTWFHGWCLADAWGDLSSLVKKALGISALLTLCLLASRVESAELFARYLLCAAVSTTLVMPSFFDSAIGLLRKRACQPGFWEAVALHRNLLPIAITDFTRGLRYSLRSGQIRKSGFDRLRQAYLLAVVVAARVPDVSRMVHTAAILRHFRLSSETAWSRSAEPLLGRLGTAAALSVILYLIQ